MDSGLSWMKVLAGGLGMAFCARPTAAHGISARIWAQVFLGQLLICVVRWDSIQGAGRKIQRAFVALFNNYSLLELNEINIIWQPFTQIHTKHA